MKKLYNLLVLSACCIAETVLCQDFKPALQTFYSNKIRTDFLSNGNLGWYGQDEYGTYQVPYETSATPSTIFTGSIWLGVMDGQELRVAANTYGSASYYDFYPGPLNPANGKPNSENDLTDFNRVWSIQRYQILQHIADFQTNGSLENPIIPIVG